MRRLVQLAVIALGIRALWRWRNRRRAAATSVPAAPAPDPADELRQKLAASRADDVVEAAAAAPETTVEERRGEVHEQARATLEDMKSADEA